MQFEYTALTKENRKTTGVIEAADENEAREFLHKMDLSVLSVKEVKPGEKPSVGFQQKNVLTKDIVRGLKQQVVSSDPQTRQQTATQPSLPQSEQAGGTSGKESVVSSASGSKESSALPGEKTGPLMFYFEVIDNKGKEVNGTIEADDRFSAFKRLVREYKFKVLSLCDNSLSQTEKQAWRQKGVADLENLLQAVDKEKKKTGLFSVLGDGKEDLEEKKRIIEQKALIKRVEKIIQTAQKVMKEFSGRLSPEKEMAIKKAIDELAVIKRSSNFEHIKALSNNLLEYLQPDDPKDVLHKKIEVDFDEEEEEEKEAYRRALEAQKTRKMLIKIQDRLNDFLKKRFEVKIEKKDTIGVALKKTVKKILRLKENEVLINTKLQLKQINRKIISVIGDVIKSKNSIQRKENIETLKALVKKRKEISAKLKELKKKNKSNFESALREIRTFIGWLLAFYLTYFLVSDFAIYKHVGISTDFAWKTRASPFLLYILIGLFMAYGLINVKIKMFKQNFFAGVLFLFVGIIAEFLIIYNL